MQNPDAPWPPRVGDVARLKATGRLGTVVRLKGVRDRRFRIEMLPVPNTPKARTEWYGLAELERPS